MRFPYTAACGAIFICAALGACTHTTALKSESAAFDWSSQEKRVVLVAPDVELGELTAGELLEPRADWSDNASHAVEGQLASALAGRGIQVDAMANLTDPHEVQLAKLHGIVGAEILKQQLGISKLPTKKTALDWTLGPGTNELRTAHHADYALFVYVRDSYSSGGRKAMMVLGALAGVGVSGGTQNAFASLVDLRTGNIVWFNELTSLAGQDLRDGSGAVAFTTDLLKDAPL
jgi:hypothetical protein